MIDAMNIASILTQAVERYPDHVALVFKDRCWTYKEWNLRVNRMAHALAGLGVRTYDRVGLYVSTNEASVTTYFACQKLGAVAVPMNFRLSATEVRQILQDSGVRILVYGSDYIQNVMQIEEFLRSVHDYVCVVKGEALVQSQHLRYENLVSTGPDSEPNCRVTADQLSALVYTSGTTGRAKGVRHSHANDVAIAMNCVMEYSLTHGDRALHIAPLYHVGGMQAFFLPHMLVGGTNVIEGRYDALLTLQTIQEERITTLFAVPTQIQEMLFHPKFNEFNVSSLRMITTGGTPISSATMERVLTDFCPNLYNGYGSTEASLTLLLHPRDASERLGSCGKSTLVSRARIIAADSSRDVRPDETLGPNETGELIVRGPQMMSGYWNNPDESSKKLRHGWLYTGDLFRRDDDGYFYFAGRADDMIVSGGENIYPREVEEVLYHCPGVQEAAVVGLPDEKWGQVVTAFVVSSNPQLTEAIVTEFCRSNNRIAGFKCPKRIVFIDGLPTNPSGKVLKRQLVADYTSPDVS
jgi:fatty-acyl-CoA synthase